MFGKKGGKTGTGGHKMGHPPIPQKAGKSHLKANTDKQKPTC